jgi:hypothetical protein
MLARAFAHASPTYITPLPRKGRLVAGLLLIVLLLLYVWVAQKIVRRIQPRWGKAVAIVIFIGIALADGIYGRIKLHQLCRVEGGVHVKRTVLNADGFHSSFGHKQLLEKYPYTFVESGTRPSAYVRYLKNKDGSIVNEDTQILKSRYAFRFVAGEPADTYMVDRFQILDIQTNELLAQVIDFRYAGGWIERAIASLYAGRGSGGTCNLGYPENIAEQLIVTTLQPPTSRN